MPSFDMVVHYPMLPLTYLRSVSISGNSIDIPGEQWKGRAKVHFDAADLASRKDSLIGYCVFKWTPYEYDCSYITFDSVRVNLVDNLCSGMPVIHFSANDGIIGSYKTCGVSSVGDNSQTEEQVTFRPNPATEFGSLTAASYTGPLTAKIINELGIVLNSQIVDMSGQSSVPIDLRSLPEGIYYISVSCEKFTKLIPFIHLR